MMRSLRALVAVACLAAATAAAAPAAGAAEDAAPAPEPDSRYSYHRVDDGFLRLDLQTGQVSLCAHRGTGWSCQAMPDDRATFQAEIARLVAENAALKKELINHGLSLPQAAAQAGQPKGALPQVGAAPPASRDGEPKMRLPSQADLDRMLTYIEKVWRRFIELMVTVQQDLQRKT